ncbi:tRNA uridine-5-carboxymethylaminomethyl(34) synthesis GTPase MnmE [Rhodovulum sp. 12E13]|uniref:tRNA uridine-5-carboxymethylaminomethyl(34) synthesis GTPase MnmE n=1 Tax=Rhodovulum sp. 12E13 TaxID=2203891 RepID=UPI000E166D35|nr:tRNA uridine-5-carboxymethylaminomethyl(34) synthesis GTPase MnmE [Rhodovulum sp. 12E13]RDC73785.1 tRNA uridine-5-carboxymethylaminomethyl(34) synthesis GTPase MnmE [Rhodovulum sp. 12E13]
MDTIFARSTAPGRAGVAIIRVSGPRAWQVVRQLTRRALPVPRQAVVRNIWGPNDLLDQGMVLIFEPGRSFTGEESAEFHLHGSEAVVRAVLSVLRGLDGLRDASAGEFTRRALENDRMNLAEVEGLGALIDAETEAQRRQAMGLVGGQLQAMVAEWRAGLLDVLGSLEASVDFADEEVPEDIVHGLSSALASIAERMRGEARGAVAASSIARGFEVAIVGEPNAGKSTLLNRLAGRDAAITSEVAGTTRDILEVRMEIGGYLVTLLDTAGIRCSDDVIERLGVERARRRAGEADLRVFLDAAPVGMEVSPGDIVVTGKSDVCAVQSGQLGVSGLTGEGIDELLSMIASELGGRVAGAGLATTERQAAALDRAAAALEEAATVLEGQPERVEVASECVRSGILAVDEVIGRIGVEDVLGEIFSRFCIGK